MYYSDQPISSSQQDLLGRKEFAKNLALALMNLSLEDTFTVGIFGKWGSGKTSLLNMVLGEIKGNQLGYKYTDKLIVIRFEPWNFSSTDQLLRHFFIRLIEEFRSSRDKKLAEVGDAIERYAGAVEWSLPLGSDRSAITYSNAKWAAVLGKILNKGTGEKDIAKQKEYVVKLLNEQQNRILIVIDDLDRLSNEQIRCMFQMITSVARFPKTTYLLAFDKEVVVKALEKVQEGSGEEYLQKIIQMPIQIPEIGKAAFSEILICRLEEIRKRYNAALDGNRWQHVYVYCVAPMVKSLRDIARISNALEFKMAAIASEIDFGDMIAITALELNDPDVFQWIRENRSSLTAEGFDEELFRHRDRSAKEWVEYYKRCLQQRSQDMDENRADFTVECLAQLFPCFGHRVGKLYGSYDTNHLRRYNSIGHEDRFDRYFQLSIEDVGIRQSEISDVVNRFDAEQIGSVLLAHDKAGRGIEFLEEIKVRIEEISLERIRTILDAIIEKASALRSDEYRSIMRIRSDSFAQHMVFDLAERIPAEKRAEYFAEWFGKADADALVSLAAILNMLELGYGRVGSGEERTEYAHLVTLEELLDLEKRFCTRAKWLLEQIGLFDLKEWRIVCHLLEHFDQEYIDAYLKNALGDSRNVVRYLRDSVVTWTGTEISYEVRDNYTKYLNEEQVNDAIYSLRDSGELFDFQKEIQNISAAFCLDSMDKKNYRDCITQEDVDKLLEEWRGQRKSKA